MTDMGVGGPPSAGDNVIDLDLGGVDTIHGWMPVPANVYVLQIDDAKVVPTNRGGRQVEIRNKIVDGTMAGRSIGIDRIFIPDRERQTPDAYQTTAGYFKGKIEAITGQPYSGRLNVRELVGLKYKALVLLVDEGFGPQNRIQTYLPLSADTTGISIPQGVSVRQPKNAQDGASNGGGGQPTASEAARFRI